MHLLQNPRAYILVSNINKHLALDSILADCQLGFRSQRSCETQLIQFVHDIISNLDGAVNRGHKQTDLIIMAFTKALIRYHTGGYCTIGLLWDKRIHPQVDKLMALWAHSTSIIRWTSLRSCPSVIRCIPRISFRTDHVPYTRIYKRPAGKH